MANTGKNEAPKLLANGTFRAEPTTGALVQASNGAPQFGVLFRIMEGPSAFESIGWWGGLEGGGFDYTTKALRKLGWDCVTSLALWRPSNQVRIRIQDEILEHGKRAGQKVSKVKFILSLGEDESDAFFQNKIDAERADEVSRMVVARLGGTQLPLPVKPNGDHPEDSDEIPF